MLSARVSHFSWVVIIDLNGFGQQSTKINFKHCDYNYVCAIPAHRIFILPKPLLFVIVIVITLTPLNSLELLMNTQVQHYTHNFALIEGTWIRKDSNTLHASTYRVTSISGSLNNF